MYRPMKASDLLCGNITLVHLVVVIFLVYVRVHIWIKMSLIVGHSRYHLSAERSGKGKVLIIQIIHFAFVSHLIDQLVVIFLKRCRSSHIRHAVNLSSIVGHVKFEADLSVEERRQLANFGKISYTSL